MDIITYAILKKKKANLVNGKVPASELPSFVDEVIEIPNKAALPATGDKSKIYLITTGTGVFGDRKGSCYRWGGTTYALISDLEFYTELQKKQNKLVAGYGIKLIDDATGEKTKIELGIHSIDLKGAVEYYKDLPTSNVEGDMWYVKNDDADLTHTKGFYLWVENEGTKLWIKVDADAQWGKIFGDIKKQKDLMDLLDKKVDKEDGKGLSTNDLTDELKARYDLAYTDHHKHTNKTVLDNTTAAFTLDQKNKIIEHTGKIATLESGLAAEKTARETKDTELENKIKAEETRAKDVESGLNKRVKTIEDNYATTTQLEAEKTARTTKDNELEGKINQEIADRESGDDELRDLLVGEKNARIAKDEELETNKQNKLIAGENVELIESGDRTIINAKGGSGEVKIDDKSIRKDKDGTMRTSIGGYYENVEKIHIITATGSVSASDKYEIPIIDKNIDLSTYEKLSLEYRIDYTDGTHLSSSFSVQPIEFISAAGVTGAKLGISTAFNPGEIYFGSFASTALGKEVIGFRSINKTFRDDIQTVTVTNLKLYRLEVATIKTAEVIPHDDTLDVDESGRLKVVKGGGADVKYVVITGSSGTLTEDQLNTILNNKLVLIKHDDSYYHLMDSVENVAGVFKFTNNVVTSTGTYTPKSIIVTKATRAWVLKDFAAQDAKYRDLTSLTNDTDHYPASSLVKEELANKQDTLSAANAGNSIEILGPDSRSHNLPKEYQELEYIEKTSTVSTDNNLKIDLGLTGGLTQYGITFKFTAGYSNRNYFILTNAYQTGYAGLQVGISDASKIKFYYYKSGKTTPEVVDICALNTVVTVTIVDTNIWYDAGSGTKKAGYFDSSAQQVAGPLTLWGTGTGTAICNGYGKVYSLKIYNERACKTLIRDLIPCYRRADNAVGLYDLVNKVFYTNTGTGTFAKGEEISNTQRISFKNTNNYQTKTQVEEAIKAHHDDTKQDKLTAGDNITIIESGGKTIISAKGGEEPTFSNLKGEPRDNTKLKAELEEIENKLSKKQNKLVAGKNIKLKESGDTTIIESLGESGDFVTHEEFESGLANKQNKLLYSDVEPEADVGDVWLQEVEESGEESGNYATKEELKAEIKARESGINELNIKKQNKLTAGKNIKIYESGEETIIESLGESGGEPDEYIKNVVIKDHKATFKNKKGETIIYDRDIIISDKEPENPIEGMIWIDESGESGEESGSDVSKEYVDKQDAILQNNINNEAAIREQIDNELLSKINNEKLERESGDNSLLEKINSEKLEREVTDNNLLDKINNEKLQREEADNILNSKCNDLIAAINSKQDQLTFDQEVAINSGIKASDVLQIGVNKTDIENLSTTVEGLASVVSVKVEDTLPATPTINTLYYIGTKSPYHKYLVTTDGTVQDLGEGEINLDQYYKKTEITNLLNNKLSLTGGTLTGVVTLNFNGVHIRRSIDSAYTAIVGGTSMANGGSIYCFGKDYTGSAEIGKGSVRIQANDGANRSITLFKPDKILFKPNNATDFYEVYHTGNITNIAQTIYDGIYPVNKIEFGFSAPGIPAGVNATWTDISLNYEGRYFKVSAGEATGTSKAESITINNTVLTTSQMPSHSHTGASDSQGEHTHTRGTMNILGTVSDVSGRIDFGHGVSGTGCFSAVHNWSWGFGGSGGASASHLIRFNAASNWNGETSKNGNHTHTISIGYSGGGQGHSHSASGINPVATTIKVWKRTA